MSFLVMTNKRSITTYDLTSSFPRPPNFLSMSHREVREIWVEGVTGR